jgi:hypothetical protein
VLPSSSVGPLPLPWFHGLRVLAASAKRSVVSEIRLLVVRSVVRSVSVTRSIAMRVSGRDKQVEAGERPARLLNASAGDEASKVDGCEAEAPDQVFHYAL